MNPKKLLRLRNTLVALRRSVGNMPSRKLENFARALGRRRAKRGKEPVWVNDLLPSSRPLAIPIHSRPLGRYISSSILDQLEKDLEDLEAINFHNGRSNGNGQLKH